MFPRAMRLLPYACLILLIGACEHKNQHDDQTAAPTGQPSPAPSPAARAAAEKAAAGSGSAMAAAGSGCGCAFFEAAVSAAAADGDMTVRAPTAADLATYTADLK